MIPFVGWIAGWFVTPLAWLIVTSAYFQVTQRSGAGPAGFPIVAGEAQ